MANPLRGEVAARIDGAPVTLRLTLGALAELEAALGAECLLDLVERVEAGRLKARDVEAVLAAGLRGAGRDAEAEKVGATPFEGGAVGATRLAVRLLEAAFTGVDPGA